MSKSIEFLWVGYEGSDWYRLYVDGVEIYEGHPLDGSELLARLGIDSDNEIEPREDYEARVAVRNAERKAASIAQRKAKMQESINKTLDRLAALEGK